MAGRLQDKVAIVTGGASGFGAGIVKCFAAEGAKVVIADLNPETGAAMVKTVEGSGGTAVFSQTNVTDRAQLDAAVAMAKDQFGGLDIMVANAVLGQKPRPVEETSEAEYDRQFDVNVKRVFHSCNAVLPTFGAQKSGNIIVTASGIALRPRPNLVVYGATKGAALKFAKGLAMEVAGDGIRVNSLCPGPGDTPMLAEFMGGTETEEGRETFRSNLPLGKLIAPEDMGWAAVYLAAESESGTITGVTLPVDSGRTV